MLRFFTSDLRRNLIKIICLTAGLAIGFIIVAKVFVEVTYDSFYPDADRIFTLRECFELNGEYSDFGQVPGGIAPGVKRYAPQVEEATRYTHLFGHASRMILPDGRTFAVNGGIMADSAFFDVLKRPILAGDPHEALSVDGRCMISRSLAEKIGPDAVGATFTVNTLSDKYVFTVGGVYEDFPLNSSVDNAIVLSLNSIVHFRWDGRENWIGNDSYKGFVRLAPGASPEDVAPHITRMLAENIDAETLAKTNYNILLSPLADLHMLNDKTVSTMTWVLSLLAVVMLMSASLNYLLVVIGQMQSRNKEMAVRKCFGTSRRAIFGRVIGESLFFLAVSMALAVLIVLCFSEECSRLLGNTAEELLTTPGVWAVELGVCALLLIVTGVVPAWMYCRTPVVRAFRADSRSRRVWKLALLAVEFFAAGLLVCLLTLVMRQYRLMTAIDLGYDTDNTAMVAFGRVSDDEKRAALTAIRDMPEVACAATAYQEFTEHASGNNLYRSDMPDVQFNVSDFYEANPAIFDVLGIEFVQGRNFSESADTTLNEVIVEERMVELLHKYFGETDANIIGKTFNLTDHYDYVNDKPLELTVCGVIRNMRRGGLTDGDADNRAAVIFPQPEPYVSYNLYIRFRDLNPGSLAAAQATLDRTLPGRELYIVPLRTSVDAKNAPVRNFGASVMIAGLAVILIAMIGLIGYTADEVNRRAREIAIRKVNGTPAAAIVRLFCRDILVVALPSLLLGGVAAMAVGRDWLAQFTVRAGLGSAVMALSLVVLLAILLSVVVFNSLRIARSNPVEHLRSE